MKTAVATLYLYDPQFEGKAKAFKKEVGADCVIRAIATFKDLTEALGAYTEVGFLLFDTHGEAGKVALADGSRIDGFDFRLLRLLPRDLLRQNARVLFYGCNIGEGTTGDAFLNDFGLAAFRGKGGTVGASTVANVSFQIGPFSLANIWMDIDSLLGARLKVVRFNVAGLREDSMNVDRWGNLD